MVWRSAKGVGGWREESDDCVSDMAVPLLLMKKRAQHGVCS